MKRILGLAFVLLCAGAVHATRAEAQCGASCTPIVSADLKVIGWGCVENPDSRTTCSATSRGCSQNDCSGGAMILDTKGAVLASAQICGGKVREVRHVNVVPARQVVPAQVAYLGDAKNGPRDLRLDPAAGAMQ
jgi:hypothetical protein